MGLVNLTSDLSQVNTGFKSKSKISTLNRTPLPRTNFLDKNGNVEIKYSDVNRFEVPLGGTNSELEILWEDGDGKDWPGKDTYYGKGQSSTDKLGIRRNKFGNSHPYVIREIEDRWGNHNSQLVGSTTDFLRGGASTLDDRIKADKKRLGIFLNSPAGDIFKAKQYGLQLLNVGGDLGERANIYNPLTFGLNTVPGLHFDRHLDVPFISDGIRAGLKSIKILPHDFKKKELGIGQSLLSAVADTVLPDQLNPFKKSKLLDRAEATKRVRAIGDKSPDEVNLIPYGSRDTAKHNSESEETLDFIPFRFKDMNNNKYIVFRALLSGITDNMTPDYATERYVGRPDQVYVYQGTNREIAFTFDVYPKSEKELPILWDKLNYLVGLVYPSWSPAGSGLGMISPFIELTIGDMYKNTPGFLSQLSLTVQDSTTWEIGKYKLPKYIQAACSFTYVGNYLPNTIGKHYELPWLKDTNTPNGSGTFPKLENISTKKAPYRMKGHGF